MRNFFLIIIFGLLLSFGVSANSQTPDGMTPAEEEVCDGLEGAAYGLCNAYCEAMDCDGLEPQASEKACFKVLEKFENKTGEPMPPCQISVCSDQVIQQCNAETIFCNGRYQCSHGIRGGRCVQLLCEIPLP